MALGDADLGERAVAAVVGEQEGGDPRRVGLERQHQHVEHELDVLRVARSGCPRGVSTPGSRTLAEPLGLLDARLDLADAGQVLVELLLVAAPSSPLHRAGVVEDEVEDRPLLLLAALAGSPAARRARRRRTAARRPAAGWARAASAWSASSRTRLYW